MGEYADTAARLARRASELLGIVLEPDSVLALGDSEAYMFTGQGYELTVRCGPCGCEAMLRRDDEPLAYCGLNCAPDPQASRPEEALKTAKILEEAFKASGAPRLREC